MSEVLTIDEIKEKYAPDWVLIVEPETDEYHRLLAGRVAFHSPVRDDVYDKAIELGPPSCAVRYLGEYQENMEFLL